MYVREDVRRAIDLMVAEVIPVKEIVTLTLPLSRAEEGFAAARTGDQVKVQLRAGTS
jgi:threonine dehydrogenase-like Zn-dependent dehydrogenase